MPPSISSSSFLASSKVGSIRTPFPAHRPSAFRTYGGRKVSRNSSPSLRVSPLNVLYPAVGILCLTINALAKPLLPSSTAPAFEGPITGMEHVLLSDLKSSYIPFTSGASGPTTTISTLLLSQKSFSLSKSSAFISTFSPTREVPALPGAMNSLSHLSLLLIFQASACSLPPLPNSKIFIVL